MRRTLLIVFCWAVLGAVAFLFLSRHEEVERPEAIVTGSIRTDHIDRIWFAPGGELVGIGRNESKLTVRVWSGAGSVIRERTVNLPAESLDKPVFAVSADAAQVALSDPAGVRVESLISPDAKRRSGRPVPIVSLAFTGSGKLAALYQDGEVEIRDIAGDRVAATTHLDIADPGFLTANGPYLAAFSSATGDAFVFDTSGDKFSLMEHKKYPRDILALTLSPQAWFAVASGETIELPGQSISAPGKVRGLAFLDRNRLLAGGDFQGIYLLSPNQGPRQVAAASPGTTVLAAAGSNFTFGSSSSLALGSFRMVQGRPSTGLWIPLAIFGLLAPVAIYFYRAQLGLIFRKGFDLPPPEAPVPDKPPEEEPIPKALVEACQGGDCILWAGSGLGAQAGLPTWSAFERELEDSGNPTLAQQHEYLRRRFRVSSELSHAHRLIKEVEFQAVVTTSLDNLLDRTFPFSGGRVYTAEKCEELIKAAARRDFFLLKPFGDLDESDTICIGQAQCAEAINSNPAVSDLMAKLFDTRVFLFIGASLEGLEWDLANLRVPAPSGRKHYALIPIEGEGWEARSDHLRQRYGIEPLICSASTLGQFLANLIELIRRRTYTPEQYKD